MTSADLIGKFNGRNIAIFGDIMLDRYILGESTRLSPEAPVPVILIKKELFFPGGAANVAVNIAALGGRAFLCGVLGRDEAAELLIAELKKRKINLSGIVFEKGRITTQKTRIFMGGCQLARLDREIIKKLSASTNKRVLKIASGAVRYSEAVVFSDYAKGFFGRKLAQDIIRLARRCKKPVIADLKPINMTYFKGATLIAPNKKEALLMGGVNDIKSAAGILRNKLKCSVLITEGRKGMTLFENKDICYFPSRNRKVFDVTGAGDTVTAVMALGLAARLDSKTSAMLANEAAGIAVGKFGTAAISPAELKNELTSKF